MTRCRNRILCIVLLCCGSMALVEALLQPGYVLKSLIKILLFGGSIALWSFLRRDGSLRSLFSHAGLGSALGLAAAVYALLLGGYFLLRPWIDLSTISDGLLAKENITAANFLFVALYISLCNSLLEELFFRGFAYLILRRHWSEVPACLFSAAAFAFYHVFILKGWFSPILFVLALAGLFAAGLLFNVLDRRGSLYPSWLVHAGANLAINTVGLMMFGLI